MWTVFIFLVYFICIKSIRAKLWGPELRSPGAVVNPALLRFAYKQNLHRVCWSRKSRTEYRWRRHSCCCRSRRRRLSHCRRTERNFSAANCPPVRGPDNHNNNTDFHNDLTTDRTRTAAGVMTVSLLLTSWLTCLQSTMQHQDQCYCSVNTDVTVHSLIADVVYISVARYHWFCATVSTVEKYRGTR